MSPVSTDDDFKLLYTSIKVAGIKPRMADVGKYMGLKPNATAWRYQALMKRLEKQFGEIDEAGSGGAATPTKTTPKTATGSTKRKRIKQAESEEEEDDDDDESLAKKAGTEKTMSEDSEENIKSEHEDGKDNTGKD